MNEIHDVVEMLLNRIKDYPEDFVSIDNLTGITYRADENKWTKAFGLAKSGATKEEGLALEAAYQAAKRAVYMGAALQTILSDDEPVDVKKVFKTGSQLGFGSAPIKSEGSLIDYAQIRNEYQKSYATNND